MLTRKKVTENEREDAAATASRSVPPSSAEPGYASREQRSRQEKHSTAPGYPRFLKWSVTQQHGTTYEVATASNPFSHWTLSSAAALDSPKSRDTERVECESPPRRQ
ncbi:hypothetical protein MTO96_000561 [Rhipicephalus appendiculatus]